MKIGVAFPARSIPDDPAEIALFAQTVEGLGYDHLRVNDHVVGAVHADRKPPLPHAPDESSPFHELFVTLGFLSGVTSRITLVAGVLVLPQRQTVLVAKQAAEVSLLSKGRLRLGIGIGWNPVEFESLGMTFEDRWARSDEQIVLLRELWSADVVDFRGKWHRVERAGICPRSSYEIPLWVGGFRREAWLRGIRVGDGFMFGGAFDDALASLPRLKEDVADEGADNRHFGVDVLVQADGDIDRWTRDLVECRQSQIISDVTVAFSPALLGTADRRRDVMAAYMQRFEDVVGPTAGCEEG